MNKSRIEKYLLEKTNKLVFITLDDIILKKIEGININKNIEVPVFSSVLISTYNISGTKLLIPNSKFIGV